MKTVMISMYWVTTTITVSLCHTYHYHSPAPYPNLFGVNVTSFFLSYIFNRFIKEPLSYHITIHTFHPLLEIMML